MELTPDTPERGGFTRWTRLGLFVQVTLVVVLSVAAAVLAIEVTSGEWLPGARVRADLTVTGRNTLDPELEEILERLPGEVTIETFLRLEIPLYKQAWMASSRRLADFLGQLEIAFPDKVDVVHHDMSDLSSAQARYDELGISKEQRNVVVIAFGDRREVLPLYDAIAIVRHATLGAQRSTPAELLEFRGPQVFAEALAKVSLEGRPVVYFTAGHGELDAVQGSAGRGLDRLRQTLTADGFDVKQIEDLRAGIPEDADIIAIVGAELPFGAEGFAALTDWVDAGGRLLVALGQRVGSAEDGSAALLSHVGVRSREGFICQPVFNPGTGQIIEGVPVCADLVVGGAGISITHPITRPLREHGRKIIASRSHSFERELANAPSDGLVLDLFASEPESSWRDLPDGATGRYDFALTQFRGEELGPHALAMTSQFPPRGPAAAEKRDGAAAVGPEELVEARVLALGTAWLLADQDFDTNRDLARNAFNWLADREFRISVAAIDPNASRLDMERGRGSLYVAGIAIGGLPLFCVLAGVVLAWRRSR